MRSGVNDLRLHVPRCLAALESETVRGEIRKTCLESELGLEPVTLRAHCPPWLFARVQRPLIAITKPALGAWVRESFETNMPKWER
jgi:hypothetical protein